MTKGKQLMYYLRSSDLARVLKEFSETNHVVFVECGLFDTPEHKRLNPLTDDSFVFDVPTGNWNLNHDYLIVPENQEVMVREVPQRAGGMKYAIDALINQNSLICRVGGEYMQNIIAGHIATASGMDYCNNSYSAILKLIKKQSRRVKGWYVSLDLNNEYRLTTDTRDSESYDLKLD